MNILYIANNIFFPGTNGGTVHTYEVAKGLINLGHNVFLVCEGGKGQLESEIVNGIPVLRIKRIFGRFPYFPFLLLGKLKKINISIDFIIERNSVFGGVGVVLSRKWKVPYLLEVNTAIYDELILHRKINVFKGIIYFIRFLHFKTSEHIIGTHINLIPKYAHDKFTLTIWGVNTAKFSPAVKYSIESCEIKAQINPSNYFTVLVATSDSKSKGLENLEYIIKEVIKKEDDIRFLIVGIGEKSNLYNKLKNSSLNQYCYFIDKILYDEVEIYMSLGQIGLSFYSKKWHPPYKKYGFFGIPIKVLEYQALGLPVVSPKIGNMSKIVKDGETGILVEEDNFEEYANAIINIKNNGLYNKMSVAARDYAVNSLTWENHINQLNKLISAMKHKKKLTINERY